MFLLYCSQIWHSFSGLTQHKGTQHSFFSTRLGRAYPAKLCPALRSTVTAHKQTSRTSARMAAVEIDIEKNDSSRCNHKNLMRSRHKEPDTTIRSRSRQAFHLTKNLLPTTHFKKKITTTHENRPNYSLIGIFLVPPKNAQTKRILVGSPGSPLNGRPRLSLLWAPHPSARLPLRPWPWLRGAEVVGCQA